MSRKLGLYLFLPWFTNILKSGIVFFATPCIFILQNILKLNTVIVATSIVSTSHSCVHFISWSFLQDQVFGLQRILHEHLQSSIQALAGSAKVCHDG